MRSLPLSLAMRQLEIDKARTRAFPFLLERKWTRMSGSPLALLRGAAPLFYEILKTDPRLRGGPDGRGWIVGDAHLENFGAYRIESLAQGGSATFDLNDFDETTIGDWHVDVLRLTTSLLLGARALGLGSSDTLALADALIGGWASAAFDHASPRKQPRSVVQLIEQAESRTRLQFLTARTERVQKSRRFIRGERYRDLPGALVNKVYKSLVSTSWPKSEQFSEKQLEVVDAALRIAGTGSLGTLRVAALVAGKGGPNGSWIFDMKQMGKPCVPSTKRNEEPAERVILGLTSCLQKPPRLIGKATLDGCSMFVRRLAPQEDKLDWRKVDRTELPVLATHLGALLGRAHARGQTGKASRWSATERQEVLDRAMHLAGLHEAIYLALPVAWRSAAAGNDRARRKK